MMTDRNPPHPILVVVDTPHTLRYSIQAIQKSYPISCQCHVGGQQSITQNPTMIDLHSLPDQWMPAVDHFLKTFGPDWALLCVTAYELNPNTKWLTDPRRFTTTSKEQFAQHILDALHNNGSLTDIDDTEHCLLFNASYTHTPHTTYTSSVSQ